MTATATSSVSPLPFPPAEWVQSQAAAEAASAHRDAHAHQDRAERQRPANHAPPTPLAEPPSSRLSPPAPSNSTVTERDEIVTSSSSSSASSNASCCVQRMLNGHGTTSTSVGASSRLSVDDFEILTLLGKGSFGKVFQVRQRRGPHANQIFALKSVKKSRIMHSQTDVRHTRTERDVLSRVHHPFLVKMYYAFEMQHRLYFVQEFCRGGELFRLMETQRMLDEDHARFYLGEILCALDYLHQRDIIYRDLKTENIMIDAEGHIKLIDFGLSKIFGENDLDDEGQMKTHTFCGTVEYMAPEVVLRQGHAKAADWWSFGVFTFDLLVGRSPFHSNKGKKDTKERIVKGKFNTPRFVTPYAQDLIRRLLRKRVDRRLGSQSGADELRAHEFFQDIDWDRMEGKDYPPPHVPDIDAKNEADISQFDTQFTSRTPKESVCKEPGEEDKDNKDGDQVDEAAKAEAKAKAEARLRANELVFADFDYVSPEMQVLAGVQDIQLRSHGD